MTDISCGLDSRVMSNIRFNAQRLARYRGVPGMALEDLEQDLVADLLHRRRAFDPSRASFATFADRVVRHRVSTLMVPSLRSLAEGSALSLDAPVAPVDDVGATLGEKIPDPSTPLDEASAIRIDVSRFVAGLPQNLVSGCEILLADTVSEGAAAAGINRSTAYEWVARLRDRARAEGLSIYLTASNTSRSESVSGGHGYQASKPDRRGATVQPGYRRRLLLTAAEFDDWLERSDPGAAIEYHRGFLALDVEAASRHLPDSDQAELKRVSQRARIASNHKLVLLVQRRHGACDYSYLAIKRGSQPNCSERVEADHV